MTDDTQIRIKPETLQDLSVCLLQSVGIPADDALVVSEHLVTSSLMGVDSHGIIRLPQYMDLIVCREINPVRNLTKIFERGAMSAYDGAYCLGPAAGVFAAEVAVNMAQKHGISITWIRHTGHAGRIGAYTESMAKRNVAGIAFCNSPVHGHFVSPPNGREGRLATNPIAFAFPGQPDPITADFSTSAITEGGLRLLHNRELSAPRDVLINTEGAPTLDTHDFYGKERGAILPLGGMANGHKGFALSLLVEILAATFVGDRVDDPAVKGNNLALIGIDLGNIPAGNEFPSLIRILIEYIQSAKPIDENQKVRVPGEKEREILALRKEQGIPVDGFLWNDLLRRAEHIGYQPLVD